MKIASAYVQAHRIAAKLIKANNTQTPIKSSDFRSTDPVQVSIEAFINSKRNILYNKEKVSYERKVILLINHLENIASYLKFNGNFLMDLLVTMNH
mgnify:CR=1 FL=1